MREKLYVQTVERWCSELKFKIKGKDIRPFLQQDLKILDDDSIYSVSWKKERENLIEVEGYYTQFNCGDLVDRVDLLRSLEV